MKMVGLAGFAGAVRVPYRKTRVLAAAVALFAALCPGSEAQTVQPLEHHATVLNGAIVGSAFPLEAGLVVTNAHVVEGLRPGDPVNLIATPTAAKTVAEVVAISPRMDLAVLRAPRDFLEPVEPGDAPRIPGLGVKGAGVDASGWRGMGPRMALAGVVVQPVVEIEAYGPGLIVRMLGVRPGFSGGPVIDDEGRLVGMITAIRTSGATRAARGASTDRRRLADEAFVLRAADIRREALRLLRLAE